MCSKHAGLIDTDEVSYTVEMLKRWRELAELRADLSHRLKMSVNVSLRNGSQIPLASTSIVVHRSDQELSSLIGKTLTNSCIEDVWGQDIAFAVRDLVVELARNEFDHGDATEFHISVEVNCIKLRGNGVAFDLGDLITSKLPRGGAFAAKSIREFADHLVVTSRRAGDFNETDIAFITSAEEAMKATSCAILYDDLMRMDTNQSGLEIYEACSDIYVVVPPEMHFSPSHAFSLVDYLKNIRLADKGFVIVTENTSRRVAQMLADAIPKSRVMFPKKQTS